MFAWIRAAVKKAFLEGIQDAVDELQTVKQVEKQEPLKLVYDSEQEKQAKQRRAS